MGALFNHVLVAPMTWVLTEFTQYLGHSLGLAIIAFTIVIRLVLFPLTRQQLKSSRAQQALQPQLQAVRAKFGNDKEALNRETMRLYKENNANPITGCLPTLLQLPILWGMYYAMYGLLRNPALIQQIHLHVSFLWVPNLALPDFPQAIVPGTTPPQHVYNGLFILPLLAGALQWIQMRMSLNPAANQDPQQRMMSQVMQFMPLMVIFFGYRFPAGLALYWVTNTLVGIVQQYFITGWGSLVLVVPALHRLGSPRVGLTATPTVIDGEREAPPRPSKAGANGRAPRALAGADGAVNRRTTAPAPEPKLDGIRNGQGQPGAGGRRNPPANNGRTRPVTRKQGSKR